MCFVLITQLVKKPTNWNSQHIYMAYISYTPISDSAQLSVNVSLLELYARAFHLGVKRTGSPSVSS
jgi:hypothetical protein